MERIKKDHGVGGGGVLQYCKGQRKERRSLMQSQTTGWRGEGYYNTAMGREKKDVVSCSHRPRGGGGRVLQYCKGQRKERRSLMQSQTTGWRGEGITILQGAEKRKT